MGKDFRVGLVTGVVLAGAALIWVATRPSLSPQAKVAAEVPPPEQTSDQPLPWQELPAPEEVARRLHAAAQPTPAAPPPTSDPGGIPVPAQSQETVKEPVPAGPAPLPNLPDLTIYEQAEPIKTTRFHIVRKGDTLSGIAQQYYGSPTKWRKILTANQKAIKDPNRIAPGTKLILPD